MSQPVMPDSGRKNPVQSAALADPKLLACRDIALQLLLQSFDGFFSRLEKDFFELAEKSSERTLRDIYFAARAETLTKQSLIKAEFRQQFLDAFDQRLQELGCDERGVHYLKKDEASVELTLVANEEYEENLTVSSMASAFKSTGGEDLRQMESRLARLVPGGFEQNAAANPICPEAICEAMLRACRQIESGVEARIVALRAFESQLTQQMGGIFRQVNEFLVLQNVQPVSYKSHPLPTKGRQPPSRDEAPPAAAPIAEHSVAPATASLPAGLVNMTVPAALAAHLERLLSGSAPQPAALPTTEFSFLDQLQRRLPDDSGTLEGEPLLPASGNLISLLQATPWAQGLGQMDAMTLNLVALLFDRLFDDTRLPEAIKGLIGRLQIPVLKVALLDSAFFSRKQHPARQLLDRLAEAAIDWYDDADAGNPRFDKLSAIVTWIVVNFEDDIGIFDQALTDLESFLLAEADAATSQIQDDVQELAAVELNELGLATAESLVSARLFKRDIPVLLDEFVRHWWVPALAQVYGADGENEPRFVTYVAALDDLLWSVEPKRGTEERLQLVNCLPRMLKTLEEGATQAGMPAQAYQAFTSELVHCHASAIRNGMRPPSATTVLPVVEEVVAPPTEPVYELPPVSQDELPKRWAWVDLQEADGSHHKLRLTWISPQGTRFLFTNRAGTNGHTFTRAEIETLIRNGRLRSEEWSGSLTDGVFDELRHTLAI